MDLKQQIIEEHQKVYKDLEVFLLNISKVKNTANNPYLLAQIALLLPYVQDLLDNHFKLEEEKLFVELEKSEPLEKIINDHKEIREKYQNLKNEYLSIKEPDALDLTHSILYPAYNLIATINHHAQREDALLTN